MTLTPSHQFQPYDTLLIGSRCWSSSYANKHIEAESKSQASPQEACRAEGCRKESDADHVEGHQNRAQEATTT
jgi:hypothetical protein